MAKFPHLPLFTDAFIADTLHLTAAQTGAYLMLLICAWRSPDCSLPDDDKKLAAYARMSTRVWQQNKDVVMSFWEQRSDGNWTQKRLVNEYIFAKDKSIQQKQNAEARWLKNKDSDDAAAMPTRCQVDAPIPIPIRSIDKPSTLSTHSINNNIRAREGVGSGGFKNSGGEGGYDIIARLTDDELLAARQAAPGWDVYHHASVYNAGINSGERDPPKHPGRAFAAWCKSYRKGKSP